jgi:hypothetical protein
VRGPHSRPHVPESILGDRLHAAEVRCPDLQIEVRVI